MFNNFEDVKRVAEKFGKGKIIPQRVLKALDKSSKKQAHKITFGLDMYRVAGKNGSQVFAVDFNDGSAGYLIKVANGTVNVSVVGNFYGEGGNFFVSNVNRSEQEWIDDINKHVFECNFLS
jgi:hypothetical protein